MNSMSTRDFLKAACAGAAGAALAGCSRGGTGARRSGRMINWRLQTYAGSELAKHVVKPAIDAFNKVAEGRMHIDLYCADQLVPTSELFSALMEGSPRSSLRSSSGASPGASSRRRSARR